MFNKIEYDKQWQKEHPDYTKNYQKKWRKKYPEEYKLIQQKYRQTEKYKLIRQKYCQTENYKLMDKKHKAQRKRNLGFIPMFENPFDELEIIEWHHVNNIYVVAIPKDLHKLYCGKYHREKTMEIVKQVYLERL